MRGLSWDLNTQFGRASSFLVDGDSKLSWRTWISDDAPVIIKITSTLAKKSPENPDGKRPGRKLKDELTFLSLSPLSSVLLLFNQPTCHSSL